MTNVATKGVHQAPDQGAAYVVSFDHLRMTDVESVGGKNASLGEMISQLADAGVRVLACAITSRRCSNAATRLTSAIWKPT